MIDEGQVTVSFQIFQQRLDELEQVIDLLQLAAAVLIHFAVARQDMQFLQQFDGLVGANFVSFAGHRTDRHRLHGERATGDGKREKLLPVYPKRGTPTD